MTIPVPVYEETPPDEKFVTLEEFWEIVHRPENEGKKLELVWGVVVEETRKTMGGAGGKHGSVTDQLAWVFNSHVRPSKLGRIFAAETGFRLSTKPNGKPLVRCPDVAFVRQERVVFPIPVEYIPYPPDIAIEVVSPGNMADELHDKVRDYLKHGVLLVWIVYPTSQTVMVHTPNGAKEYELDDILDAGEILPDFRLPVKDIFVEE